MIDEKRLPNGLLKPLTRRQLDVAVLAAQGHGTTDIAGILEISYDAAKMHVNAIADLLPNPAVKTPLKLLREWAIAHRAELDALRDLARRTAARSANTPHT